MALPTQREGAGVGVPAQATPGESAAAARCRPRRGPWLYPLATVALIALVLAGFWPSYFGPLLQEGAAKPWIIHLHAAVFGGWMLLLLAQVALVAAGRVRAHQRVGNAGIAYGGLVLALGLAVAFAAPAMQVRSGAWTPDAAASFLILPLGDMALFGGLFGAAIAYRRRPEIHKRLMLAATVALAFPAAARLAGEPNPAFVGLWLAPLLAAMGWDFWARGRPHPVLVLSLGVLLLGFARVFLMESEGWMRVGGALLAPFL
jgi:hypothetical protein